MFTDFLPENPDFIVFGVVVVIVACLAVVYEVRTQARRRLQRRRSVRNLFEARQRQRVRDAKKATRKK